MDDKNEEYYLKIWVFKKEFMSSQVVESVKEMIDFYTNTFEEVSSVACLDDTLFTKISRAVTWEKGIHLIYYTDVEFEEYLK